MTHFTVRFEIKNANSKDYLTLEERLANFHFTETIESEEGERYILPTGEYRLSGEFTRQQVLDMAVLAASPFKTGCKILVTESNGTAWAGLLTV